VTDDLLARATSALRETTAPSDAPGDEARLAEALREGQLALATTSLRDATEVDDTIDEAAFDRLANDLKLDRATDALRDEMHVTPAPPDDIDVARLSARRTRRGRARFARFVALPIAAAFVIMVGWASASGRLARWIAIATHTEGERSEHERAPAPSATPVLPSVPSVHAPIASALPDLPPVTSVTSVTPVTSDALPDPSPPPPATAPAKPVGPDADALYRTAHEAHFVKKDPASALAAWDRYLAAAPQGRFALEAKYNRAISLVRLGRRAEAAAALRPFADGQYGDYRKEEARELLQSLE